MAACKRCGSELPAGALVCPTCPPRQQTGWTPAMPAQPGPAPAGYAPPGYQPAAYTAPTQPVQPVEFASSASWISNDPYRRTARLAEVPKGGFWVRTLAYLIDSMLLSVSLGVMNAVVKAMQLTPDIAAPVTFFIAILGLMYFPGLWSDLGGGQTVGMRLFNLRVIRTSGRQIGLGRAFWRYVVWGFMGWLSWLFVALDPHKQGIHDKAADTYVIVDR